ncbi:MAG: flavodoxin family protein [Methanomicrobiales archaeon]|nr:flavodoxin family protein [Methanomicrobiales archaeon]
MDVKVLGISGSPRRHGNTETLLDSFLEGTKEGGAESRKVILRDLNIVPCRGCNVCHKDGTCILRDDLETVFDTILSVDILAVASPIYTMGITAETKALIDRSQYLWARKYKLKTLYFSREHIQRHKGLFISTAGQGWDYVFNAAFPAMTAFFDVMGFEYYDNIIANDMDRYGGIRGHPTALTEAREKGKKVVEQVRKLQGTESESDQQHHE